MKYIAAFDCDGTLIHGDATRCFLLLLRGPIGLVIDLCALAPQLLAWHLGRCSIAQFKEALLNRALQSASLRRREIALSQLPLALIAQLNPKAVGRLHWHQQHGHRSLIVTTAQNNNPYCAISRVELIAAGCSDLFEVKPSSPCGSLLRTPKAEKLRRLEQHRNFLPGPHHLEAYGIAGRPRVAEGGAQPGGDFILLSLSQRKPGRWIVPLSAGRASSLFLVSGVYGSRFKG